MTRPVFTLSCGHLASRKDHVFVASDGHSTADGQKCLDRVETRLDRQRPV